jgi:hypothetical protein
MNARKFNRIIILAGIVCVAGCSDYLDLTPTDRISDKVVWESDETVQLYMNTFYAYTDRYGNFSSPSQFNGNLTEGLTETLKYGSYQSGSRAGDANNYVFYPDRITSLQNLLNVWTDTYTRIRRVNDFLVGLEKFSKLSDAQNLQYEAEARFFRAFLYFQLAKRHDGVILYRDMNLQKDINRSSAEETWDLIEEDLDFAASHLLQKVDRGRLTKGAAFALKSRAMLYAERWQSAKNAADSVFALNVYRLTDKYEDAWKGGNTESILEYSYLRTGPNHSFDKDYATFGEIENQGGSGVPTQEMVEAYEKIDGTKMDWSHWRNNALGTTTAPQYITLEPRFHATIIYPGSVWQEKTMENCVGGTNGRYMGYREDSYTTGRTVTGYYLKKFRDESNRELTTYLSTHTWVELRLAEVYLNRAEANFRLNQSGAALNDLNTVCRRTGVALPAISGVTGNDLFNAIRQERKIELAYEGHLYWDMRRWRLAHIEYNNYRVHGLKLTKEAGGYIYQYVDCDQQDRLFLEKTYVLPIPDAELNNNSAIEQYDQWK